MTDAPAKPARMQFSWWLPADLGERLVAFVQRQGPRVWQRDVAEKAIRRYLDQEEAKDAPAAPSA
jgi:hypothetical protein